MRRWRLWLTLIVLAGAVLLAYQSAVFSSRSGDAAPPYSVRRHDPYGTAALYTLLVESGVPTRTLERAALSSNDHGTLIQVLNAGAAGPSVRALQTAGLAEWMAQGNTVIQLSRGATDLMTRFHVTPEAAPGKKEIEEIETAEASGRPPDEMPGQSVVAAVERGPGPLVLRAPMTLVDQPANPSWRALARLGLDRNKIVAGELRVGRGRLIVIGAPGPALNATLGERGNLDFLLTTIGRGPVIFDEWSHGVGRSATIVGFLKEAGLLPLVLQVGFIIGLYVWSTAGRPRTDDTAPARPRAAAEQIATLGHLYARSLGSEATFDRVSAELNRRLADALRCRPAEVPGRIGRLAPDLRDRCTRLFDRLARVRPPRDVRCTACGYDLRGNTTGRCPECGVVPTLEVRRRVAAVDASVTPPADRRPSSPEAAFIDVLNQSHSLSEEIRSVRRVLP